MKTYEAARLGQMPPFLGLNMQQLRDVMALAEPRRLIGGAVIFNEGQPVRHFSLLMVGDIRFVRLTAEGDQIIVLHIQVGQMFGIGVALGQITHQTTAIAANDCLLLSWPNALWPGFCAAYPAFAAATFRALGARADEMSNRIVELSTKLVEQRIACALLRMIGQSGRKVAGGVEIVFPLTRGNIADMTGTTLHTVSRVLSGWEKLRLIESTRCHIVVIDPHRMVMISLATGRSHTDRVGPAEIEAMIL